MRDYNEPHKPRKIVLRFDSSRGHTPVFIAGRLYVGYIGVYWINPLFTFTFMILSWQKGSKP